jgi:HSP20 family protein
MAIFGCPTEFDPVRGLLGLQAELERAFDNRFGFDLGTSGRGVFPPVNVFGDRDGFVLRLEVPGVAPEDLKIESEGRALRISGKRQLQYREGGAFHRRERAGGEFSRSLQLPGDLDLARAEATCRHGMLTIRIPKREEARPRQISIQAA